MALEPGGYADKLGNRYESRWVTRQMLRLLNEETRALTIEAVGDDEYGVDLWIERADGTREAQQCKARNTGKDAWTVADLDRRGILKSMTFQLDRAPNHEFSLVSAVPTALLGDLCESARHSSGDSESFYYGQIQKLGVLSRNAFGQFCLRMGLNEQTAEGRRRAHDYLRRLHFYHQADDRNFHDELLAWAGMLLAADSADAVGALTQLAAASIRKPLTSADIRSQLTAMGIHSRQLDHDTRVASAVEALRRQFEGSISPDLINGQLLQRAETQEVLKALQDEAVVVLHGAAGIGKSGVLLELTKLLESESQPYLPIRLDRQVPRETARRFGEQLGLPESPALCLKAMSKARLGVLILDQLDALRWTSAHSSASLDVCKSVVREIRDLRSMGYPVSAVLSCRTFDLEHDPEIRNWLAGTPDRKCVKVEVKPLSEDAVKHVVEVVGGDYDQLEPRQRRILSSPHLLAMWSKLTREHTVAPFVSGTELMRQFWRVSYQKLAQRAVSTEQADAVLDTLVDYMERHGRLSAPLSLVASHQKELTELHTEGILRTADKAVTFCHQSYLDFRIADRLLRAIYKGEGSVRQWLGVKEAQTLFRREQLRQVLLLLCDESPEEFLRTLKGLLADKEVRFHLKHLALEITGTIANPWPGVISFVTELVKDPYWQEHVLAAVHVGHPIYVRSLAEAGVLGEWLHSDDEKLLGFALWLLRSINESSGDFVADAVRPFLDEPEWQRRVFSVLCLRPHDESESLFLLRLHLVRGGIAEGFVEWSKLVATHPLRAVQLIEAALSSWKLPADEELQRVRRRSESGFEHCDNKDTEALRRVSRDNPYIVWDMLMAHVDRQTAAISSEPYRLSDDWAEEKSVNVYSSHEAFCLTVVDMIRESSKAIAAHEPDAFLARARHLEDSLSSVTQRILAAAYALLPPSHADAGIRWLLANSRRFELGEGIEMPIWTPAASLIKQLSPHCSDPLYRELETRIVHYHEPHERDHATYHLETTRKGYYGTWYGKAQHFLLPALCIRRLSPIAQGLMGCLERKFAGYEEWRFLRGGHISGGSVGSPIKNPERLSDGAWLSIVGNRRIPAENGRWKQLGPDHVGESTIRHFADAMRSVAQRYPGRFGLLALQFPRDAHPLYLSAILRALGNKEPKDVPENERIAWTPASGEVVEAFLERFTLGHNVETASSFCWMIRDRAEEQWSDGAVARLLDYTINNPDPRPDELNVWASKKGRDTAHASPDDLLQNSLNCVRGAATLAIGSLLWAHPDWLPRLTLGIDHAVNDPNPAVRTAALEAVLPVLNINRDQAVAWFCQACRDDVRVAATHWATQFFNHAISSHYNMLAPVIRQMLNSNDESVAEQGAREVAARTIFYGLFEPELITAASGTSSQRKGVAGIAGQLLAQEDYGAKCLPLVIRFLNDADSSVRQEVNVAFRQEALIGLPDAPSLLLQYVSSAAYRDDPTHLLFGFEKYPGSLLPYASVIAEICNTFVGPLRDATRDVSTSLAFDMKYVSSLLLRLYEQAHAEGQHQVANRCLDSWDSLFEARVGPIWELTRSIDQ